MARLPTVDRVTAQVLQSKWSVLLELVLVLVPISLLMAPALFLLSLVVAINPVAVLPLTLTAIGGIWGLTALWCSLFSLFRQRPASTWTQLGLIAGSLTMICFIVLGKHQPWSLSWWLLSSVPVALHWVWLKRQGIVFSFRVITSR